MLLFHWLTLYPRGDENVFILPASRKGDMVNDMVRPLEFLGVSKLGPTIFQHKIHLFTADMKNSVYKKDASYHSHPHPTGKSRSYNLTLLDMALVSMPCSS